MGSDLSALQSVSVSENGKWLVCTPARTYVAVRSIVYFFVSSGWGELEYITFRICDGGSQHVSNSRAYNEFRTVDMSKEEVQALIAKLM